MFNIFEISPKKELPVLEKPVVKQPTPFKKKASAPSIKADALKTIEKLLGDLQNVNNPKVDSLRKLFVSLENGSDLASVMAFYKEPIKAKKKKKLISGKFY